MVNFLAQDIPNEPGVYVYRNLLGEVIYVGKAKSLRRRMSSYFQASRRKVADNKLRALINSIASYEYYVVKTESEALVLEDRLIKQFNPKYNIDLRDDKRYYHIAMKMNELYPYLQAVRLPRDDGSIYFGPFPGAGNVRFFIERLNRYAGLRLCTYSPLNASHAEHCLNNEIGLCPAPCLEQVSVQDYGERVQKVLAVLRGNYREFLEALNQEMKECVTKLDFEMASELRDIIRKVPEYCSALHRSFKKWNLAAQQGNAEENMKALQEVLNLEQLPVVIECLDMSHLSGTMAVGSVVCFRQGKPSVKEYRRFRIKDEEAIDDTRRMREVMFRRYREAKEEGRLPNLIIVDGGKPQLNAACEILAELGLDDQPIIALAERFEEIFLPNEFYPIVLPFEHGALRLLRAIRDEAHRFAVSYNRLLRQKKMVTSLLDDIAGIGEKRKVALLKEFGSVAAIRKLKPEDIVERKIGIGEKMAVDILNHLNRKSK